MCVCFQAKQHAHMRTHMADECKNDYAAQLQKYNKEQNQFYYSEIPSIFNVSLHTHTHTCTCTHIHTLTYTRTQMHTCTHANTHTPTSTIKNADHRDINPIS